MNKRVFGPDHGAVLMTFVKHRKIQIRIRILGAQGLFDIRQGEEMIVFIDIHLLQTHHIGILLQQVLQHLVLLGLLKLAHTTCIPGHNGDCYEEGG